MHSHTSLSFTLASDSKRRRRPENTQQEEERANRAYGHIWKMISEKVDMMQKQ